MEKTADVVRFDLDACTRCGQCVLVCPQDILRINRNGDPFAAYEDDCTACRLCELHYAYEAITINLGGAPIYSLDFVKQQYLIGLGMIRSDDPTN